MARPFRNCAALGLVGPGGKALVLRVISGRRGKIAEYFIEVSGFQ